MPIKTTSGRRLIIQNVSDTASFSARRLSFNAKELQVEFVVVIQNSLSVMS